MEAYKLWVRRNRELVHSLESLANGVTWLLPERFSNSEIAPEAVYALLGIISAVNQHILDTTPSKLRPAGDRSFPWPLCLSVLKDAETVIEVAAHHLYGEHGKWNFIAATEATKALVRLALLRDSGYRMLLQFGETPNTDKAVESVGALNGAVGLAGYSPEYHGYVPRNLEGRAMSALSRFGENAKLLSDPMWLNRLQPPAKLVEKKPTLASIWYERGLVGRLSVTGEVLFILRPLMYVMLIRRYGIRSWWPWLISLAVDVTGMSILSCATSPGCNGGGKCYQLSASDKDELKRRKLIWTLYLMRDPFFTNYTKNRLEKTNRYLSHLPFIGFLSDKLVELVSGAQTRYTYTSGS